MKTDKLDLGVKASTEPVKPDPSSTFDLLAEAATVIEQGGCHRQDDLVRRLRAESKSFHDAWHSFEKAREEMEADAVAKMAASRLVPELREAPP